MTLLLTFREEGLHAVVTIDRKKGHWTNGPDGLDPRDANLLFLKSETN